MNDSVHIILWLWQLKCNTCMSKQLYYNETCQASLQSCPDTFQMFDESSGSCSLVYLHAANNVWENIEVFEEYIVFLNKVNNPSTAEQFDWWCNFPVWIGVVCWREMKVESKTVEYKLYFECMFQSKHHLSSLVQQMMIPFSKTRVSLYARVLRSLLSICQISNRSISLETQVGIMCPKCRALVSMTTEQTPSGDEDCEMVENRGKNL